MCRLAAYLGFPISLKQFLLDPDHSLYVQSWQPKELHYAKLNADGFGVGWYQDNGTPARYRNMNPIWSDTNLADIAATIKRDLWIAMVRSATPGYANSLHNTQPFCDADKLFIHNGRITDFQHKLRRAVLDTIHPDIEAQVIGLTDSEYIFALIRQFCLDHPEQNITQILQKTVLWLQDHIDQHKAMLNIIISTQNRLYALRCAIHEPAPSLYYRYQDGSHCIASERLTKDDEWETFPDNTILTAEQNKAPVFTKL